MRRGRDLIGLSVPYGTKVLASVWCERTLYSLDLGRFLQKPVDLVLGNMSVIDITITIISRDTDLMYPVVLRWEEVPEPVQVTARVGSRVQEVQRQQRCLGATKRAQLALCYPQMETLTHQHSSRLERNFQHHECLLDPSAPKNTEGHSSCALAPASHRRSLRHDCRR